MNYTTIEQSKKLLELGLDSRTADMYYFLDPTPAGNIYYLTVQRVDIGVKNIPEYKEGDIPCWSLASLLDILPSGKALIHDKENRGYKCICNNIDTDFYYNPIDACVEMIIKLNEKGLL